MFGLNADIKDWVHTLLQPFHEREREKVQALRDIATALEENNRILLAGNATIATTPLNGGNHVTR